MLRVRCLARRSMAEARRAPLAHEAGQEEGQQSSEERIASAAAGPRQGQVDRSAIWIWLAVFVAAVATVYLTA